MRAANILGQRRIKAVCSSTEAYFVYAPRINGIGALIYLEWRSRFVPRHPCLLSQVSPCKQTLIIAG
jgi:hypothetical protein